MKKYLRFEFAICKIYICHLLRKNNIASWIDATHLVFLKKYQWMTVRLSVYMRNELLFSIWVTWMSFLWLFIAHNRLFWEKPTILLSTLFITLCASITEFTHNFAVIIKCKYVTLSFDYLVFYRKLRVW